MKSWVTAAAVGLGLAASLSSATVVEFNQHLLALATKRSAHNAIGGKPITFNLLESQPLQHTLQVRDGYYGGSDRIPCTMQETTTNSGTVTVLLAISKCLNQSSIDLVEAWIGKVKAESLYYMDNGQQKEIAFATTLIPGECQARSELEKAGRSDREAAGPSLPMGKTDPDPPSLSDGTDSRSAIQVLEGEVDRLQAFTKFGRVLASLDDADATTTAAVLSFVNNANSYDYITTYESTHKISNTFHFQLCRDGESCDGHFENCIQLEESVDLFMYNPFQVTRSFQCAKLSGGIPVSYIDAQHARQCFCTCPAGSTMQGDSDQKECVVVEPTTCPCTWSTHPFGFRHENHEQLKVCSFTDMATKWDVPVPFPYDNYVGDQRSNTQDSHPANLENGPHIDVVVKPVYANVYDRDMLLSLYHNFMPGQLMPELPPKLTDMLSTFGQGELLAVSTPTTPFGTEQRTPYSWIDYQLHRQDKIDALTFTAYGKYDLTVEAHDYTANSAACVGCVAIVDHFRPKATTQCPVSFCDNTTSLCVADAVGDATVAEMTEANVAKANSLIGDFYKFKDAAVNDACSSERCDKDEFTYQDFFENAPSSHDKTFSDGKTCFSTDEMVAALTASDTATKNPLQLESGKACQSPTPVDSNQCMRCCEYSTHLREFWVDYTCGYDYDQRSCDGDAAQQCAFKQCLLLTGDMVVQASASIRDEIQTASKEVIKELVDQGFQTYTQIHRALSCEDFGSTGPDADSSACTYEASIGQLLQVDAITKVGESSTTLAFWRYKIEGDANGWRLWEDSAPYAFASAQTKITVEAWTACGRARKFYFYVHLHPHTDIHVCDVFKQMWYQTSKSRAEVPTALCAYPGSDFAELTFDYQANMGLKHSRTDVPMHISTVACDLAFKGRSPVEILHVEGDSVDIIERFAVELQTQDMTAEATAFSVQCTFSYAGAAGVKPVERTCPIDFTITDCNGPVIDIPQGDCAWDDCAGQDKPGPFEACGGQVVRATAGATYLDTDDHECCQACEKHAPAVCTPVLNLPDEAKDIKRCEPQVPNDAYQQETYGNYEYDAGYYDQATVFMATTVANHPTAVAATALLAASALVAVVALVVVRRRRVQAAEAAVVIEDAYYPLLH